MANTAMRLGQLLADQASLNTYILYESQWASKYEANHEKLEAQVRYFDKWENAFDSAIDNTRELKASSGGKTIVVGENNTNEDLADKYAHAKVKQYDEDLSAELAELDIDFDTMKTMYETLVTELQAKVESEKQTTATGAQDTGLLQS